MTKDSESQSNASTKAKQKPAADQLSQDELEKVSGGKGKATPTDFTFTHVYDKSSPII